MMGLAWIGEGRTFPSPDGGVIDRISVYCLGDVSVTAGARLQVDRADQ